MLPAVLPPKQLLSPPQRATRRQVTGTAGQDNRRNNGRRHGFCPQALRLRFRPPTRLWMERAG